MSLTDKLKSTAKYGGIGLGATALGAGAGLGLYQASNLGMGAGKGLLPTGLDSIVTSASTGIADIIAKITATPLPEHAGFLGKLYANIPGINGFEAAVSGTGDAIVGAATGLGALYTKAASLAYGAVKGLFGFSPYASVSGLGLSGITGIGLAGLAGAAAYVGLAYLTYKGVKLAGKPALKLANYVITAPFRGIKNLIRKAVGSGN